MDSELNRPTWQLPPGVSRGTWDYVHRDSIATEYDTFMQAIRYWSSTVLEFLSKVNR